MLVRAPFLAILGLLLLLPAALSPGGGGAAPAAAGDDRFGIVFVNAPGYPNAETRYARAQAAGAGAGCALGRAGRRRPQPVCAGLSCRWQHQPGQLLGALR